MPSSSSAILEIGKRLIPVIIAFVMSNIATLNKVSIVALMLAVEPLLSTIPTKLVYLGSVTLFEIGSALCSLSNSVVAISGGRMAAGFAALMMCILASRSVTKIPNLFERPVVLTSIGVIVGLMISSGRPLAVFLHQKLTQDSTVVGTFLNWCLYVNAPMAVAAVCCEFTKQNLLDSNSKRNNIHPVIDILRPRLGANNVVVCIAGMLFVGVNYLPLWSQAHGQNADQAGVRILPVVVSAVASLAALTISNNFIWPIFIAIIAPMVQTISFYGGSKSLSQHDYLGRQMMYGASLGAMIRYFAYMSEATEYLISVGGFIEAAHRY